MQLTFLLSSLEKKCDFYFACLHLKWEHLKGEKERERKKEREWIGRDSIDEYKDRNRNEARKINDFFWFWRYNILFNMVNCPPLVFIGCFTKFFKLDDRFSSKCKRCCFICHRRETIPWLSLYDMSCIIWLNLDFRGMIFFYYCLVFIFESNWHIILFPVLLYLENGYTKYY